MRYNVAQLLKELTGISRHYVVDETIASPEPEWGDILPVQGPVDMVRTSRGILVTAHLQAKVQDTCARCLEPATELVDVDFEEEYFPMIDIETGAPLHLPADSDGFTIDRQHQLDLTEALRQGVLMARGLTPLCRPDCKGLCPECGNNLNNGPCSCAGAPGDPRWGALKRRRSA